MGQLIVHDLDDDVVRALEARARANGRTAEAEHRAILLAALSADASFWDWIRAIPQDGGGDDSDFARSTDLPRG